MSEDTGFIACAANPEDCQITESCKRHSSHHQGHTRVGFWRWSDGCPGQLPQPEQDGWVTMYASQGALR